MIEYNRHIFDSIDNANKAYWLGFIVADGYLNQDKHMLRIKLGDVDKHHLEKFIDFVGGPPDMLKSEKHNITGNTQWYVSLYSKEVCQALNNLKVYQGKSANEHIPPIPQEWMTDFIRGLWDGDGFIREKLTGIGLVGSHECLEYVQNFFLEKCGIKPLKIYEHCNTYKIEYRSTKKAIPAIIKLLYQHAETSLDRKQLLADQIIEKLC